MNNYQRGLLFLFLFLVAIAIYYFVFYEPLSEEERLRQDPTPLNKYKLAELLYSNAKNDSDPVIVEALKVYKEAVNNGYPDCLLRIGEIYHFCNLPKYGIPNLYIARSSYNQVIKMRATSPETKIAANLHLVEINKETLRPNRVNRLNEPGVRVDRLNRPEEPFDPQILRNMGIMPTETVMPPPPEVIRNDSQNVHDSTLQKTFKESIEKLKKIHGYNKAIPRKDSLAQLREYIHNNGFENNTRKQALATLDNIENVNSTISNLNDMCESEILNLVWNRIHHPENDKNRENIKDILVQQLADGSPDLNTVCASGRATRIISALDHTDARPIVELKPKWAIKEQLMNQFGLIRNKTLGSMSKEQIEAYNNGGTDNPTRKLAQEATEKIKSTLRVSLNEQYVKSGILTQNELNLYIKPMLNEI